MTPTDPPPPDTPRDEQIASPPAPAPRWPFWDYQDLAFFITLCFPALLVAALVVKGAARFLVLGKPFQGLLAQFLWYALIFGALLVLLRVRYRQPFWRSLGWRFPFSGVAVTLLAGPVLAIAVGYLGYILRTPEIKLPFEQMLQDRPTTILFAIFVALIGPLCEELAFRGFLMPLLIRSFGAAAGIVGTGLLFGCMHAYEYAWSWRHVVLISVAGSVFGWARYRSGSTAASTLMHSTYNATQLAAFLVQQSKTI